MGRERAIRTVIVDDERLARQRIRRLLEEESDVDVIAECRNGYDAIRVVQQTQPDLLFLDIEMPEVDAFAVIEGLREMQRLPHVVFVTAFDKYAVRAFDVSAVDYLLKPVERARLSQAVRRARGMIEGHVESRAALAALLGDLSARPRRFTIHGPNRIYFVAYAEIDWIEAAGNYVRLHAGRESHLMRTTMNAIEEALSGEPFVRIHRSTIVNVQHIKELRPTFAGDFIVLLHDGQHLTLSRTYRAALDRITRTPGSE